MKKIVTDFLAGYSCAACFWALTACTPEVNLPTLNNEFISAIQSQTSVELKADWKAGDSVSVFFGDIKTPKYFTIQSVDKSGNAVLSGDIPYGIEDGTMITAIYPHTEISADVTSYYVDLSEQYYRNGSSDKSRMVYTSNTVYSSNKTEIFDFKPITSILTLNLAPFEGFNPSDVTRVDVKSNTLTSSSYVNCRPVEGEQMWKRRENKNIAVLMDIPVVAKYRSTDGGAKLDLMCIPTEGGQKINDLNIFITAGEKMFYAEVTDDFEIKAGTSVISPKAQILNQQESGALIFQKELELKDMNSGVFRNSEGVFLTYYSFDFEQKKVSFYSFEENTSTGGMDWKKTQQTLIPGYYTFDWEKPVANVKGISYNPDSKEISVMINGDAHVDIDGNNSAVSDFLKGSGAHYEVKFDRSSSEIPVFTRGAMSVNMWKGAMAQGRMNTLELNKDRNWSLVTYPDGWTSYQTAYEPMGKDRMKATHTGGFDFDANVELNEEKLGDNILKTYFSENLYIPMISGMHIFYVINTETGEWFKLQPQNEEDFSQGEGSLIERMIKIKQFETGVFRKDGEFLGYYSLDFVNKNATFYSLTKDKSDIIMTKQAITIGKRNIVWDKTILDDISGIVLNAQNVLTLSGGEGKAIDNNLAASDEFLNKGVGHHYHIKIDRTAKKCSAGNMSPSFVNQVLEQGKITDIEVNKDWNWDLVTFPDTYTFYKTTIEKKGKDVIDFGNDNLDCDGGYSVNKELNENTVKDMLQSFYDENIVVRQKTEGLKSFYVINKTGKGWFLFARN